MKKRLYNVVRNNSIDEIMKHRELPPTFSRKELALLQKENHFPQEYFWVEDGEKYAFGVIYQMRTNLFTFGKWRLMVKMSVIGYPCSLSEPGYVTNDEELFLDFASTIRGALLILNVVNPIARSGFAIGQTLPTCMFTNIYKSREEYLNSLRSSYRRRLKLAMRACKDITAVRVENNEIDVYPLYLATYEKSDYKLEKLERGYFNEVEGIKIAFIEEETLRGFVLLRQVQDQLIFMLCGMNYQYETADLYYFMLLYIISYAIENGCKTIDFGQTSEKTKMKLGALLSKRYFYAHHSNKLINTLVRRGKGLIEYKYDFPDYHVFK